MILLEHVNFKIPFTTGKRSIESFYVNTLGCPECVTGRLFVAVSGGEIPIGTQKQMHVNIGLSQIHFEWCTGDGRAYTKSQKLRGCLTVAMDSVSGLKRRLIANGYPFYERGVGGEAEEEETIITTTDPFGNTLVCVEAPSTLKKTMKVNSPADRRKLLRSGGVGHALGLIRLDMDVSIGLASKIASFYRDRFGSSVQIVPGLGAEVATEAAQIVRFNETPTAPPGNAYELNYEDAIHFCIYVEDFRRRAEDLIPAFWVNPDYSGPPLNDHVVDLKGALDRVQFRIKAIGEGFVLEHEVRGVNHPLFPRL